MTQTASTRLPDSYLDPHLIASISPLQLRARLVVEGMMTGMHRSPFHGVSVEFSEHRQYTPGDDLRHLDWKVFGRSDKLYIKQYQQETNLTLLLLVDVSGSMAFGKLPANASRSAKDEFDAAVAGDAPTDSPSGSSGRGLSRLARLARRRGAPRHQWRKYDCAATLAAALAHLTLGQQDRVGLALFGDSTVHTVRPSNASEQINRIVESLSNVDWPDPQRAIAQDHKDHHAPRSGDQSRQANAQQANAPGTNATPDVVRHTDLSRAITELVGSATGRSLVLIVSDLLDDPQHLQQGLALLSHRGHDAIIFQTLDHAELTFPYRGPSEFFGLEGEGRLSLDPAALRKAYLDAMQQHQQQLRRLAAGFGFDLLTLDTSDHLAAGLSRFLARRDAAIKRSMSKATGA